MRESNHAPNSPLPALALALAVTAVASLLPTQLSAQRAEPKRGADLPEDRAKGGADISEKDLKTWITALSSVEFAGRGTGQQGFLRAAMYVRDHFKGLGLKPCFEDKYFQTVPWSVMVPDPQAFVFKIDKGGKTIHRVGLAELRGNFVRSIDAKGKAVAISVTADNAEDALDEIDLEDSIVFVLLQGDPKAKTRNRILRQLGRAARQGDAGALIVVHGKAFAAAGPLQSPLSFPKTSPRAAGQARRVMARMSNSVLMSAKRFDRLLESLGSTRKAIIARKGNAMPLGGSLTLQAPSTLTQAPAMNVGAVLEGSDPKLRDEYLVIGCHLDHKGKDSRGRIYPGADDDGSGSAGLMALARAFVKNGKAPRRSVLFVAFCGEENGLIGSGFFAKNSPIKLEQIAAELQIDMIGRNEEKGRGASREKPENNKNSVHLVGSQKLSKDLHDLCVELNKKRAGLELEWDEENVFYRSDHWNFAKHGVPIAFFFTGFHPDYHKRTDTVEKINFPKLARIVRYVYDIGFELCQRDERPMVDAARWNRLARKGRKQPVAPVRKTDN